MTNKQALELLETLRLWANAGTGAVHRGKTIPDIDWHVEQIKAVIKRQERLLTELNNICYHIDTLRYAQEQKFSKQELDLLLNNVYQAEVDASKSLADSKGDV